MFLKQRWQLAIRPRQSDACAYGRTDGYHAIEVSRDRFHADPCLVDCAGASYVFFEEYCYLRGAGVISCMELSAAEARPFVVLQRPYHLSFPFVFSWSGEMWMIPETSGNGSVELYRATRFPAEWKLERVLLNSVAASDTVLFQDQGRTWLFTCLAPRGLWDELHIFHADSPLGPWRPHVRNPVVRDLQSARSAGGLFRDALSLIRPAQNCANRYGRAVRFHQIDRLTDSDYSEHMLTELAGDDFHSNGVHTYSRSEHFEVIDLRFDEFDIYGKILGAVGKTSRFLRRL